MGRLPVLKVKRREGPAVNGVSRALGRTGCDPQTEAADTRPGSLSNECHSRAGSDSLKI